MHATPKQGAPEGSRADREGKDTPHQPFEAVGRRAGWALEQPWLPYLALGGTLVVIDLEAYLAGLMPISSGSLSAAAVAASVAGVGDHGRGVAAVEQLRLPREEYSLSPRTRSGRLLPGRDPARGTARR